ncbi:MAG: Na/Pi symporter [Melioribacteraceae bacterium]
MNVKKHIQILIAFLIVGTQVNILFAQASDSINVTRFDSSNVSIVNENGQHPNYQTAKETLEKPFKVRVLYKNAKPVEGWPVYFSVISSPQKSNGTKFSDQVVLTDVNGYAQTFATLGSKAGNYEFSARIKNTSNENDIIYFKAIARGTDWIFFLVSGLIGGLALFLLGMEMMSEGMKKSAGGKLRTILGTLTNNRIIAVGVGTFVTMIIQSSSATTVMLVSFVQARLMTFAQSLGIILGADIGTTVTAQLIAFKLTDYALLFIGIGFAVMFFTNSKTAKNIGRVILGFGLLFFGMWIMSKAMYPLRTFNPFIEAISQLENPILGILVGALFTALIQSSSAFTGIIIMLATQGLVTLEAAIPLLLGANIGTSITAALASINTGREAKRVALAHTLFKLFGVVLFVWWIPYFADLVRMISPKASEGLTGVSHLADEVPRQVANAHTIFNVALTIIVLPFTNIAAKWIERILPDIKEDEENGNLKTKYLEDSLISTPALALNLAKAEIILMATKVQKMVEEILPAFLKNNSQVLDTIRDQETEINFMNIKISKYLMKISQESYEEERADEVFQMMHSITELEQIGDIVAKSLIPLAEKKIDLNVNFSKEGQAEIEDFHLRTMKQLSRAVEVFKDVNLEDAQRMKKKHKKYRLMELELRRTHFDRLKNKVPESVESSEIHLELIDLLKRISSNSTNIARIFLELRKDKEEEATLKVKLSKIEKDKKKKEAEFGVDESAGVE